MINSNNIDYTMTVQEFNSYCKQQNVLRQYHKNYQVFFPDTMQDDCFLRQDNSYILKFTPFVAMLGVIAKNPSCSKTLKSHLKIMEYIKYLGAKCLYPQFEINNYCEIIYKKIFSFIGKDQAESEISETKNRMERLFDILCYEEILKKGATFLLCSKQIKSFMPSLPNELIAKIAANFFTSNNQDDAVWEKMVLEEVKTLNVEKKERKLSFESFYI